MSQRLADLPLVWKILLPYLALVLVVGIGGSLFLIADLQDAAEDEIDRSLLQASLSVRARLKDRELYLLESANFAANIEGMAPAVSRSDTGDVSALMSSVMALKPDLHLLAVVNRSGIGVAEVIRPSAEPTSPGSGTRWTQDLVVAVMAGNDGSRRAGFLSIGARPMMVIAAPICSSVPECAPTGAVVVGIAVDALAAEASESLRQARQPLGIRIYDTQGGIIGSHGLKIAERDEPIPARTLRIFENDLEGRKVGTLFAPLHIQGSRRGVLAVSFPAASPFEVVKEATLRLATMILLVLAGITLVGIGVSRLILRQVKPLLDTSVALEQGQLDARTPVFGKDELGRLAHRVNEMADELEASHRGLEERVAERTAEVERLLEERTRFFASISHEFRTPLATVLSEAKMMIRPKRHRSRLRDLEAAKAIEESGQQLLRAINDILELTRTETGNLELSMQEVSLRSLVDDWRGQLEKLAESRGVALSFEIPPDLPMVRADPVRLREVAVNLVDNALKYTPSGGRVMVRAEANSHHIDLWVEDSGLGIPEEAGERVFEPFFRVPGHTPQHGEPASGLGLAIAKRLIEAQNGSISYTSEQGVGTRFLIRMKPCSTPAGTHPSLSSKRR